MFFQLLADDPAFPDPALAEEDGLLAIGGDLSMERLLIAYSNGIFPWFSEGEPILWYSPHERCVIYPDRIKISKSMKQVLKQGIFKVTLNQAFEEVILNCATTVRKGQDGTWITTEMQQAYLNLHQKGYAHSVEVWQNDKLVGGLYGLKVNRVFCGESMFSHVSNASKTALIFLSEHNVDLIDCQLPNDHLMTLGAEMISRERYMEMLQANEF
ncbi:leucyl/phenylalanyl-tRNA--protein transferase [Pedobacter sp. HDW13]|uniref:leucyl/phenylalanyl-tRNA--protein transferase n=1 Tax=unclassified Pedobacter TaxID=2628915 RepID=UPI000F597C76|nr:MULTISPECIES: leucyl/phenylalanyl-tRNA--protein transferase [unclassified Pedobacter]QIL39761.1 leucyl/phenylalanyl-tRNA--protein transferase [Pedobacter sp. HDW13]RQO79754.1 leucyl/phenylalanyl-tRNA--protein transferase [Pedobacter sp. KBW01]